ncbi:hypothetical protein [Streptomyces huiliensis]|uniref:hypothetical protein n=1 Tax=Streptomyces huiliensis TaxID=2876027 RepID=UPI001CBAA5AF|nr:hypothetical protein [Streptomyces huiliensis]MBZ4321843.1 hypothetical protein [Streptomyces huiliensis]
MPVLVTGGTDSPAAGCSRLLTQDDDTPVVVLGDGGSPERRNAWAGQRVRRVPPLVRGHARAQKPPRSGRGPEEAVSETR